VARESGPGEGYRNVFTPHPALRATLSFRRGILPLCPRKSNAEVGADELIAEFADRTAGNFSSFVENAEFTGHAARER